MKLSKLPAVLLMFDIHSGVRIVRPLCVLLAIGMIVSMFSMCVPATSVAAGPAKQVTPQQAAGDLDVSFNGGIVTAFSGVSTFGNPVVQQSDGKIVAAGLTIQIAAGDEAVGGTEVVRYNLDGTRDASFGDGGAVTFGPAFGLGVSSMALQPDGKIVLLGSDFTGVQFALVRLNTDGSTDASFGKGQVITGFSQGGAVGLSVAVQPDGKIVAVGGAGNSVALARYNPDGSLDQGFGTGGEVIFQDTSAIALSVAIQPDGKIVIGGINHAGVFFALNALRVIQGAQLMAARLNADGTIDTQFASNGVALLTIKSGAMASQIALQPDGKIVAAGMAEESTGLLDFALARFNQDGGLDESFGSGGQVLTNFDGRSDAAFALTIQPDGKIVAAGGSLAPPEPDDQVSPASQVRPDNFSFLFVASIGASELALARYNTDGSLDSGFGSGGVVTTPFNQGATAFGCLVQADGKIVVSGTGIVNSNAQLIIARYSSGLSLPVFSLSADTASQTLEASSEASFVISVQTPAGGTPPSGPIALTASISPSGSGIAASFISSFINAGGSTNLDLMTSASTPPASYTITITGTSAGVAETTTVTLIVIGPGFSLGFSQPSITAQRGTKVPVTILIDHTGGLTGKVTVRAPASLPPGIVLKGAGSETTKGGSVTFKLKVTMNATPGSNQLTFTGTDAAGQSASATLTLVVQ